MNYAHIHLDSNFLIRALDSGSREDGILRIWLSEDRAISISSVAWSEFLCGPIREEEVSLSSSIVSDPRPFTGKMAALAARLFNATGRSRGSLADCMIAATAITEHATLATFNRQDFEKFAPSGLVLV